MCGTHDEICFFELVRAAEVPDELAPLTLRPEPLLLAALVLADDRRRRVENDLRRSVIALELDDLRLGEVVLEVEDIAQIRAAPAVDGLIGISDDSEVPMALRKPLDQVILRPVRVLVFVHHHEPELFGVLIPDVLHLVEQLDGLEEEIVEIERAIVFEALDVLLVDPRKLLAALAPSLRLEEIRTGHGVLRMADLRERHP